MFRNRTFPFQKNWRNGQSLCGELSDWCSAVFPARFSPNTERKRDLITAKVVSPLLNWLLFVDRHEKGGSPTVNKPPSKKNQFSRFPQTLLIHFRWVSDSIPLCAFFYATRRSFRCFFPFMAVSFYHELACTIG